MKNYLALCWTIPLLLIFAKINTVNSGKILIIIPAPSFSHQIVYQNLIRELSKRGHEIVYVTPNPIQDKSLNNYKEIDMSIAYKTLSTVNVTQISVDYKSLTKFEIDEIGHYLFQQWLIDFYSLPEVRKIIENRNEEKFDVVICEGLTGIGYFAMAHILNAPLIVMTSVDLHMYHNYLLGSPILPSHLSNLEFAHRIKPDMSFWDRIVNYVHSMFALGHWYYYNTGRHEKVARSLIGFDIPPLMDIAKNASLFIVNQDLLLGYATPLPPNVIQFTGMHLSKDFPALSTELNEFLGNATNGFIYMSLGSNVKSVFLQKHLVKTIYNVFSRLPYKILWKYEADDIPRSSNILTAEWFPQRSILAHPNIKLFIQQGGLQSTEEAIHHGVPMIGIPMMFDQFYRVQKLESLGIGRKLEVEEINEDTFHEVVYDVLNNKSYKEKVMELRRLMKDKPYESKENVIWWVEYVMRNKGAPHLRFSGADESWFRRYDTDIIAFLSIILFLVTIICAIAFVRILRWLFKYALLKSDYKPLLNKHKNE
ncbi:UDP-glucuronosyltransferase 1-3-like [Ceratina calcarata]|uniref:UDP-glucuronosyltransferase 1-3-like n=1 Tax=Ceratina calcarata TaxID=156304 RepID=A0AAJ7N2X7_9HYME|nr:UDP-glucuronosyltransferase 1-3-like [Ceratina calcarata]